MASPVEKTAEALEKAVARMEQEEEELRKELEVFLKARSSEELTTPLKDQAQGELTKLLAQLGF